MPAYRALVVGIYVPVRIHGDDQILGGYLYAARRVGKEHVANGAFPMLFHALIAASGFLSPHIAEFMSAGDDGIALPNFIHIRAEVFLAVGAVVIFYVAVGCAALPHSLEMLHVFVIYGGKDHFSRLGGAFFVQIVFIAYGAAPIFDISALGAGDGNGGMMGHVMIQLGYRHVIYRGRTFLIVKV